MVAAAAVLALAVAAGIAALALGWGADEEPVAVGTATVREATGQGPPTAPAANARRIAQRQSRAAAGQGEIAALVAEMPLQRRVAQLFLLGFRGDELTAPIFERLRTRGLGGVVIGAENYGDPDQLAALAGEPAAIAERAGHVAPWVLAPQEGGELNAFRDLPPRRAPVDLPSNSAAFDEAKRAAATLGGLGIDGVLAPIVDVAAPDSVAVGARAYSDDPRDVSAYARAVVGAYRGGGLLTAAGRFPGLGSASADTRLGVAHVGSSLGQLHRRDLVPFRAAIRAGVPAIVIGHGLYVTDDFVTPATMSEAITTELLRDELGFEGLAITDDLADPPITALSSIPVAAVEAVRAGADLLQITGPPEAQEAAYAAVLAAVRKGRIARERLDEAVARGLAAKRAHGLLD